MWPMPLQKLNEYAIYKLTEGFLKEWWEHNFLICNTKNLESRAVSTDFLNLEKTDGWKFFNYAKASPCTTEG